MKVALVGDYSASVIAHQAIPLALELASEGTVKSTWVGTASILNAARDLEAFDAIWCVPASPYENPKGALDAIRFARESGRPFLGTCGGFQHAVIEYARNVLGWQDADHAEDNPATAMPLIAPLACSLVEKTDSIHLLDGSRLRKAYGEPTVVEGYHCSYGLNPQFQTRLFEGALVGTAFDVGGEVRGMELQGHPFFVATLFQPERRALSGKTPPLVKAFCDSIFIRRHGLKE